MRKTIIVLVLFCSLMIGCAQPSPVVNGEETPNVFITTEQSERKDEKDAEPTFPLAYEELPETGLETCGCSGGG